MTIVRELALKLWQTLKGSLVLLLSALVGMAVISYPLQQHFSMGRLQHYGLGFFCVGMGYILQLVWSRGRLKKWARLGHLASGLYLASMALTIYANPWLEPRVAVRTEAQENLRSLIFFVFAFLAVPQVIICVLWINEELQSARKSLPKKPS